MQNVINYLLSENERLERELLSARDTTGVIKHIEELQKDGIICEMKNKLRGGKDV